MECKFIIFISDESYHNKKRGDLMTIRDVTALSNTFKYKRFLIAGGAGFLGSHFIKRLLRTQHVKEVIVLDNFSTGSMNNLSEVSNDIRLKVVKTDISQTIPELNCEFDSIWHLAALANPTDYEKNPIDTLTVNSDGSKHLIELAHRLKADYFYFSSSEIYGMYDCIPYRGLSEVDTISRLILGKPRSPYAIGKCFGEELTRNLCDYYGVKYLIIRPFNVYGPNMDVKTNYGRVIPNFITWALKKAPLQINGDGSQIRTFCYIDDFIHAILLLIKEGTPPMVINIGSQQQVRIIDLANLINQMLDNEAAGYVFAERYQFEPLARIPDLNLIKKLIGWEPSTGLKKGLHHTIDWLTTRLS